MILDDRLKTDEIEKRKIVLANANELSKIIMEKSRDESCSEELNKYNRMISIDTDDGKENYFVHQYEDLIEYSSFDVRDINKGISNIGVKIDFRDDSVAVIFIKKGEDGFFDARRYSLDEKNENLDTFYKKIDFSKVEGNTFIERILSVEDEFFSKGYFKPGDVEHYKECFRKLKGMLQPFVVQDIHYETDEAKYRREIKEKIDGLENELAEKKKELEAEKEAHQATRERLEEEERICENLEEKNAIATRNYQDSQNNLSNEKNAHDKTKQELNNERTAHNNTKSELAREREEHGKTKQFLSALEEAVKAVAVSKLPKTGKAFMADIKEKFSKIVRGKGLPEKDDILRK